jgi:2-hydroxy fatty acid dioxygenase
MGASKFEQEMRFYAAYHNNLANQIIHIVFVPLIVISLLALLSHYSRLVAMGAVLGYALYYLSLDVNIGLVSVPFLATFYLIGSMWGAQEAIWGRFLVTQAVSWGAQVAVGHKVFEKRAPALLDSWQQAFLLAPLFVIIEALMMVGFFPAMSKRIRKQADADIS